MRSGLSGIFDTREIYEDTQLLFWMRSLPVWNFLVPGRSHALVPDEVRIVWKFMAAQSH
jgi:hypothetical protein